MAEPGTIIGGFIAIFMVLWLLGIIVGILGFIFWILMIVDVAKRKFKQENDKLIWILVVVLAGIIGAIVYYFVIKREDKH